MKNIIFKIIPIFFIVLSVSGLAKAETYANIAVGSYDSTTYPNSTRYTNTITIQTDKPIYSIGEIVKSYASYHPTIGGSITNIDDADEMYLIFSPDLPAESNFFGVPYLSNFQITSDYTPGTYKLYVYLPYSKYRSKNTTITASLNNFNLLSYISNFFVNKAEACISEIRSCDYNNNCTTSPLLPITCHPLPVTSYPNQTLRGYDVIMGLNFTVTPETPKIFSR